MKEYESKTISVIINKTPAEVFSFASDPSNLPLWASGLATGIEEVNGEWIAESPMGKIKFKFVDLNTFGVLDHEVTLPSGQRIMNPMRVVANAEGCEVLFTLGRLPDMSDEKFEEDALWVQRDLENLKKVIEAPKSN